MGKGAKVQDAGKGKVLDRVWTINGKTYDLTPFEAHHPGGEYAMECAAAHPHGELFVESYHPDPELVYQTIQKYEVKGQYELVNPVNSFYESKIDYTFEQTGFYRKLKKAAMTALRGKTQGKKKKTNLRGDDIYLMADMVHLVLMSLMGVLLILGSWKAAVAYGILRAANIMRIAHVASHASLSPYPEINNIMYYVAMVFAGTTPELWSRKHVVRHHVNTNEDLLDEDRMEPLKCAGKGALWFDIHEYQHIYMWFIYVHVLPLWSFSDIIGNNFRQTGALPYTKAAMAKNMITQFLHVLITYVLPVWVCGWWGLFMVEINTVFASTVFGFEFIVNHEIEGCDIYNDMIGKKVDWGKYQAISSADFHPKGWGAWFMNQLTGGLNLQICHHLFPGVHYRHYPRLTEIIYEHMEKEGCKPCASATVFEAVYRHHLFLKQCSQEFNPKNTGEAKVNRRSLYVDHDAKKQQ
eukprot:TRINITY_DN1308_c0_g1_i1.p1 TRINITY_DN1308_c0_g1~~TRINITY_DN1308_c0_g1_i1.p1  ORF type:complete len:466 (+),score=224.88 TRINITY_DN1308_c0_g1_i1:46-1443(+)